jgi:hypothetical protein
MPQTGCFVTDTSQCSACVLYYSAPRAHHWTSFRRCVVSAARSATAALESLTKHSCAGDLQLKCHDAALQQRRGSMPAAPAREAGRVRAARRCPLLSDNVSHQHQIRHSPEHGGLECAPFGIPLAGDHRRTATHALVVARRPSGVDWGHRCVLAASCSGLPASSRCS